VWLLIVEALIALGLFVFIVWWTVRSRHETPPHDAQAGGDVAGAEVAGKAAEKLAEKPAGDTHKPGSDQPS
jgi:hypothetical protein